MYFESNFVLHLNKFYKNKRKVADIYIVLDEGLAGKNLDQDDELMIFRISGTNYYFNYDCSRIQVLILKKDYSFLLTYVEAAGNCFDLDYIYFQVNEIEEKEYNRETFIKLDYKLLQLIRRKAIISDKGMVVISEDEGNIFYGFEYMNDYTTSYVRDVYLFGDSKKERKVIQKMLNEELMTFKEKLFFLKHKKSYE